MISSQKIIGTIEHEGFELGYCIDGTGIPTLVIGSAIYYPRTFSKNLRSHLRMVFMDHRGFAKSLKPFDKSAFELDKLVDDIEALRQNLGLTQIAIMGHSGHAFMALEYAKKYPACVSHVLIIASSPNASPNTFYAADRYFNESVCPERKTLYESSMKRLQSDIKSSPEKRFILYSLRSGPRIWYDAKYDAAHLWQEVKVIPEMFDYVWGELFKKN
ncbi:MAG TPA: alpha/beta hydrolase [Gammaproteobacteria bacterium]|nr:alpha/beta hydrolase [Gammaproteobacteria bacterium]